MDTLLSEDIVPRLGLPELDEEHIGVTQKLNSAYVALSSRDRSVAEVGLRGFLDAVINHFASEERTMIGLHYPAISEHMEAHATFIRLVRELIADLTEATDDEIRGRLYSQIVPEYLEHMRTQDSSFRDFLAVRSDTVGFDEDGA